jgi:hypothetical protein
MQVSQFPDAELWATAYVRGALAARAESYASGVTVGTTVPTTIPARLVTVRRDGGPRVNMRQEVARLGVNVWAATEQDVTDLTRLVRALFSAAVGNGSVRKVTELSGPSPIADTKPRRYFVVELTIAGSTLTV